MLFLLWCFASILKDCINLWRMCNNFFESLCILQIYLFVVWKLPLYTFKRISYQSSNVTFTENLCFIKCGETQMLPNQWHFRKMIKQWNWVQNEIYNICKRVHVLLRVLNLHFMQNRNSITYLTSSSVMPRS